MKKIIRKENKTFKEKINIIIEDINDCYLSENEGGIERIRKIYFLEIKKEFEFYFQKHLLEILPKESKFPCCENGCGCGVCNQIAYGNKIIKQIKSKAKIK